MITLEVVRFFVAIVEVLPLGTLICIFQLVVLTITSFILCMFSLLTSLQEVKFDTWNFTEFCTSHIRRKLGTLRHVTEREVLQAYSLQRLVTRRASLWMRQEAVYRLKTSIHALRSPFLPSSPLISNPSLHPFPSEPLYSTLHLSSVF
jgi:hypothetical protein